MKQKSWYKPKAFTHLTQKLNFNDKTWVKNYVSDESLIENHKFYPLIHRTIVVKRYKKVGENSKGNAIKKHHEVKKGKRVSTAKYREIYYPNHLDAHIYSYYTKQILEPLYESELKSDQDLDESVIAYRRIEVANENRCKCNIDFANETFDQIKKIKGEAVVLALDISKFFDSLNHKF
jgi:hypothetical protein